MTAEGAFLVGYLGCCAGAGGLVLVGVNADRIVVAVIRRSGLPVFPLAVSIAVAIFERPEQWTADRHHLSHPKIGSIWIANAAYGLHVETEFGDWKPNRIERRIIRDAVDWRQREYLRNRITQSMRILGP